MWLEEKKNLWFVIFLCGILFFVVQMFLLFPQKSKSGLPEEKEASKEEINIYEIDIQYVSEMEKKLEDTLRQMEGVGEVSVMITLKESTERVVEKDVESSSESAKDGENITKSSTKNENTIFVGDGKGLSWTQGEEGDLEPYVRKQKVPAIEGVVIVAEGGGSPVVIQQITEAVEALFGIETHKIRIVKRSS